MKRSVKLSRFASPPFILVIGYLLIIALGTLLLMLPVANHSGHAPHWIDSLLRPSQPLVSQDWSLLTSIQRIRCLAKPSFWC